MLYIFSFVFLFNLQGMTFKEYVISDYKFIKAQARHNACYKRITKKVSLKKILRQKRKIRAFCQGKYRGYRIKYEDKIWYAYLFYKGPRRCKRGRYWFFPRVDCSKVSFN